MITEILISLVCMLIPITFIFALGILAEIKDTLEKINHTLANKNNIEYRNNNK